MPREVPDPDKLGAGTKKVKSERCRILFRQDPAQIKHCCYQNAQRSMLVKCALGYTCACETRRSSLSSFGVPACGRTKLKMSVFHDEVEIEDFEYDEETEMYYYPCPCGDRFVISKEDLENGEEVATCPSCSLIVRVIYDKEEFMSGEIIESPSTNKVELVHS